MHKWAKFALKVALPVLYPTGSIATIRRGYLKGSRYIVCDESGYAPIWGRWEPDMVRLHKMLIHPSDTIYDLGANVGIHTMVFAKLVGDHGHVVSFEPLPSNLELLRAHCSLNGLSNVAIMPHAVGSSCKTSLFHVGAHSKQGSLVGIGCETGEQIEVDVVTLDSCVDAGLKPPDLVKIDVEGAEASVLRGFERCIKRSEPSFTIELHTPEQDVAVGRFLSRHGYRLFRLLDDVSKRNGRQRNFLQEITDPHRGWPSPSGVWGTIAALPPKRLQRGFVGL